VTGTLRRTADESNELVVFNAAPTKSMASASASAERDPAPSSSIADARLAVPNWPIGSSLLPACTTRVICASGTSWLSTIQTGNPLDSVRFWMGGSVSSGVAPSAGGLERSTGACATRDTKTPWPQKTHRTPRKRILRDLCDLCGQFVFVAVVAIIVSPLARR
jgi:hypothetical protein